MLEKSERSLAPLKAAIKRGAIKPPIRRSTMKKFYVLDPNTLFNKPAPTPTPQVPVKFKKQKPDFADYVKFFEDYQKFQKFLKDSEKKEEKKEDDKKKKIDPWTLVILLTAGAPVVGLFQILIASVMFKQIGALFH